MGYVSDQIQFRTVEKSPNSIFALAMNKVRDTILAAGMSQVSQEDWPGQIGNVVTGTATGDDVSLDDFLVSANVAPIIGHWVFKHPNLPMYVRLTVKLISPYFTAERAYRFPLFEFDIGGEIDAGNSAFVGATVSCKGLGRDFITVYNNANAATGFSLTYFPSSIYSLHAYCGESGFWIYSSGGATRSPSPSRLTNAINPEYPLILAVCLIAEDGQTFVSLDAVVADQAATGYCEIFTPSIGGTSIIGVRPSTNNSGVWNRLQPGDIGSLEAPSVLSTDKGVRVAQARVYGYGAPIPAPLAMVQASMQEIPVSFDLDGSGDRQWLPVPSFGPVQYVIDVAAPANLYSHCVYCLPMSDN